MEALNRMYWRFCLRLYGGAGTINAVAHVWASSIASPQHVGEHLTKLLLIERTASSLLNRISNAHTLMSDMIAGAVTKYTYDKIEPWLLSIRRSGFNGRVALIVYEMSADTAKQLELRGVELYGLTRAKDGSFSAPEKYGIMADRFLRASKHLGPLTGVDTLIWSDVRDVVFQSNPTDWLAAHLPEGGEAIVVGSENLRYQDEPWGRNNMMQAYGPDLYDRVKSLPIYCAGAIAGRTAAVLDLFVAVYAMCYARPLEVRGGGGPDQAALNLLLSTEPYSSITKFCTTEDEWVCHLGTSIRAIESGSGGIGHEFRKNPSSLLSFKGLLLHGDPVIDSALVLNPSGVPYCIVHQYDRVAGLRDSTERRFREQPTEIRTTPALPWWRR